MHAAHRRAAPGTRITTLLLAWAVALAAVLTGAGPVHAGAPPRYCFTYQDNPAPATPYTPSAPYNSCAATVVKYLGPNQYWVQLPGVYDPNAVAHVTSVTATLDPAWCQLVELLAAGPDAIVHVACFRPGGAPAPARFSLTYASGAGAIPPGSGYGYLWSDGGGTIKAWLNSGGPAPAVTVLPVGRYTVAFNNLGAPNPDTGNLQVTAVNANAARCKVAAWNTTPTFTTFEVDCVDGSGNPAYAGWTASYQNQVDLTGRPAPAANTRFGYLLTASPTPLFANFNAGAPAPGLGFNASGTTSPPVSYVVQMPYLAQQNPANAQVTAFGTNADYCHFTSIAYPWQAAGSSELLPNIECFASTPNLTPDPFFMSYTAVGP